jgi:hypothetical protein
MSGINVTRYVVLPQRRIQTVSFGLDAVTLGLAWFLARISLPAYLVGDN